MTNFAAVMASRESCVVHRVRQVTISVACIYALIFSCSSYRRIWQVLHIEARASSPVLAPGSTVGYDVVTSGEVPNRIRLELVQDARREVLLERRASVNRISAIDPRVFRYTPTVAITPEILARFHPGPAKLRLTGFGGQKLLRTPAPRVHEIQVTLEPQGR